MIDKKVLTGIFAAMCASLCCITPVLAVVAGSSGMASFFSWMEPFRPYLIGLSLFVLAYAWWDKLKPLKQEIECACEPGEEGRASFWHTKTFLAVVSIFVGVMISFPYWRDTFIRVQTPKVLIVDRSNVLKKSIHIEGMTCAACEVEGVINISVSTSLKHMKKSVMQWSVYIIFNGRAVLSSL